MKQNDYEITESDCEKSKIEIIKKKHEKNLKDNRLVDVDEMINTQEKLKVFT
jgi:hypothetical protein